MEIFCWLILCKTDRELKIHIVAFSSQITKSFHKLVENTDNVGSDEVNNKLSQVRADIVRKYLLTQGVFQEKLTAIGHGKNKPKVANDTPENQAINR